MNYFITSLKVRGKAILSVVSLEMSYTVLVKCWNNQAIFRHWYDHGGATNSYQSCQILPLVPHL